MDNKAIGQRIKNIRIGLGMTTEDFAKIFKASKGTVSKWENGYYIPNNERLKKIAEEGEVSINYLLYGSTWEYAKNKINEICDKYQITDSYFYNLNDSLSEDEKRVIKERYPNTQVKTAIINHILETRGGENFKLTYDLIDTKGFETAFLNEIGFNAAMQNLTLKEKITRYLDSMTDIEIKSFQNQKYKDFYDPDIKEDAIKFMLTRYNFEGLTDKGIKSRTKELAEIYLDRLELFKNYKPFNDSNAVKLANNLLRERVKRSMDDYFKNEDITVDKLNLPVKETIKDELSYETYSKIMDIIDNASDKLKELK